MTPYLLRLLGIPEGTERLKGVAPEMLHQRTREIFRSVMLACRSFGHIFRNNPFDG